MNSLVEEKEKDRGSVLQPAPVLKGLLIRRLATEHHQFIHLNFGDVLFISALVGVTAVDEFPLYRYLTSFNQVFFGNAGNLTPGNQVVPGSLLDFFAFGIAINLIGGDTEAGQFFSAFGVFYFGCTTEVANKLNLVF